MVGGGRAVRRGLAEVVLGALARAVLLQVARHVLARQPRRDGPHVVQDPGGDRLGRPSASTAHTKRSCSSCVHSTWQAPRETVRIPSPTLII